MVPDDAQHERADDKPASTSSPTEPAARARAAGDVTRILCQIEQGDGHAAEQLLPLVYAELRKLAAAKMAQEKPGQTLQATALVHEAYIRLVDVAEAQDWDSRRHFFAVGDASLFRGTHPERGCRRTWHLARNRRSLLGLCKSSSLLR